MTPVTSSDLSWFLCSRCHSPHFGSKHLPMRMTNAMNHVGLSSRRHTPIKSTGVLQNFNEFPWVYKGERKETPQNPWSPLLAHEDNRMQSLLPVEQYKPSRGKRKGKTRRTKLGKSANQDAREAANVWWTNTNQQNISNPDIFKPFPTLDQTKPMRRNHFTKKHESGSFHARCLDIPCEHDLRDRKNFGHVPNASAGFSDFPGF